VARLVASLTVPTSDAASSRKLNFDHPISLESAARALCVWTWCARALCVGVSAPSRAIASGEHPGHRCIQVLDDQRNPAIGRVFGLLRKTQTLIGKAAHLRHLVIPDASAASIARLIGTFRRQIEIVIRTIS